MKNASNRSSLVLGLVLAAVSGIPLAAADATPSSPAPVPGGFVGALIMWYVCSKRKAQETGGWLLYFYIQLYLGTIVAVVFALVSFRNYLPSTWAGNPSLYPLFLLSTLPAVVILLVQLAVSEKLRRSRAYRFVRTLRTVLWIDLAAAAVGTVIDWAQFQDNLPLDLVALIWPVLWLPYFYLSKRVKRVFETRDWAPAVLRAAGPQ